VADVEPQPPHRRCAREPSVRKSQPAWYHQNVLRFSPKLFAGSLFLTPPPLLRARELHLRPQRRSHHARSPVRDGGACHRFHIRSPPRPEQQQRCAAAAVWQWGACPWLVNELDAAIGGMDASVMPLGAPARWMPARRHPTQRYCSWRSVERERRGTGPAWASRILCESYNMRPQPALQRCQLAACRHTSRSSLFPTRCRRTGHLTNLGGIGRSGSPNLLATRTVKIELKSAVHSPEKANEISASESSVTGRSMYDSSRLSQYHHMAQVCPRRVTSWELFRLRKSSALREIISASDR